MCLRRGRGCAAAARERREARGNRAAGGWGKAPSGAAWRGPALSGARTRWARGARQGGTWPPMGSAVRRLKIKASEIPLLDLRGTGRGGIEQLAEHRLTPVRSLTEKTTM
jgi:hypothetical protein